MPLQITPKNDMKRSMDSLRNIARGRRTPKLNMVAHTFRLISVFCSQEGKDSYTSVLTVTSTMLGMSVLLRLMYAVVKPRRETMIAIDTTVRQRLLPNATSAKSS